MYDAMTAEVVPYWSRGDVTIEKKGSANEKKCSVLAPELDLLIAYIPQNVSCKGRVRQPAQVAVHQVR